MWGFISNYILLQVSHLPTTLLSLLQLLLCWAAIVAAYRHYHCGGKNGSQQYCIFFLLFVLGMTIVSLTTNVRLTMMASAPAMIYHCLFYDRDKTIVAIKYFSFLVNENGERT